LNTCLLNTTLKEFNSGIFEKLENWIDNSLPLTQWIKISNPSLDHIKSFPQVEELGISTWINWEVVMFRVWQTWLNVGINIFLIEQTMFIYEEIGGLGIDIAWKNTKPN
jgi:hypothetical protein